MKCNESGSLKRLCELLGNPQAGIKCVRIAGDSSQSAVPAFLAAILKSAGYRVGRFVSPAIGEEREQILVNGRPVSKSAFSKGREVLEEACEKLAAEGYPHPTERQEMTALAFWYFREKKCDIVVLEAGDEQSGDGAEEILQDSICVKLSEEISGVKKVRYGLERQRFSYGVYENLEICLAGKRRVEEAIHALEAAAVLEQHGFIIKEEAVRKGLAETVLPACLQVVGKKPLFIVDCARDAESARALADAIALYLPHKRIIYIMGALREQEYEKCIALTHAYADQILTVTPPGQPGSLSAYELAAEVCRLHPQVTALDSTEEAVEISHLLAGKDDVILAFGSIALAGNILEIVKRKK